MVENDNFKKSSYFPTLIFQSDLADCEGLNGDLLSAIRAERSQDDTGITRSNVSGLGGWHSKNYLHRSEAFAGMVARVNSVSARISLELGYSDRHELRIGTMWAIVNPPGSLNIAHVHPGCLWSGVYYVQAPENSGNIEFIEPRTVNLMNQARFLADTKRPRECWTKVNYMPRAGRMIIFPSWLYHSVRLNNSDASGSDAERVIISFNLSQHKKK
ncbi:TIGR02466 family protein [Haliea sp. E17]